MIGQRDTVAQQALHDDAASISLGVESELGGSAFVGDVPTDCRAPGTPDPPTACSSPRRAVEGPTAFVDARSPDDLPGAENFLWLLGGTAGPTSAAEPAGGCQGDVTGDLCPASRVGREFS